MFLFFWVVCFLVFVLCAWFDGVDLSKVSAPDRVRLLEYLVSKVGKGEVMRALNVGRVTFWRYLSGKSVLGDEKLREVLALLTPEEFKRVSRCQ